jgi:hypothetical protein
LTLRFSALAFSVLMVGSSLLGCGDEASKPSTGTTAPTRTARPTSLPTLDSGTPQTSAAFLEAFTMRLDAIGPNIDSVPPDVQIQILTDCGLLSNYAVEREIVAQLCNAIAQSMERHDPGLLDLVVEELLQLELS